MESGLEKIIGHIKAEADREAAKFKAEAEEKAAAIKAEAQEKLDAEVQRIEKKTQDEVANILERGASSAELKRKQILLREKQEIINEAVAKAGEKLRGLDDTEYFKVIEELFKKHSLGRKGLISFNKKDAERLPAGLMDALKKAAEEKGGEIELSDKCSNIDGGFVLSYGGVEENCSFAALIDDNIENLQDKVQKVLFG
ncbi:MAG: V-type ATP synthase subunit E [Candidatus Avilachnospira sp.]|jgi:V/A-type H+-transporting ATPase subunit E